MQWEQIDWAALERLRQAFLEGTAGTHDYWLTEKDLASYDATFAQRIGWKWDYVLHELTRRGWTPPKGMLLDWGCGSGIAHRAFLDWFGVDSVTTLHIHDRSPLAMRYAKQKVLGKYPGLPVSTEMDAKTVPAVLLLSHVLTELSGPQMEDLARLAQTASSVVWVEPGTSAASRALILFRERLLSSGFNIVAPCTHQNVCGMLAPQNQAHWCHHFASPPPEVFTDGNWVRFGKMAGIDLRSLPLSFLVLDKRPIAPLPPGATRIIGRPRIFKPHADVIGCDATGVHEHAVSKRALPEAYRDFKKDKADVLQLWSRNGREITSITGLPTNDPDTEA